MRLALQSTRYAFRLLRALFRFALWASGVLVFALLAAALHARHDLWFDAAILDALASIRTPTLTDVALAVTRLGDSAWLVIIAVLGVTTLALRRHWRSAIYLGFVTAGAGILNTLLKLLFARQRPELPVLVAEGFAFPSGHSMGSAAAYGAIAVIIAARYTRLRIPLVCACIGVVVAVGLTRAYLGVHYPSDIVAGWALGATLPLWLKPLLLGKGFKAPKIADRELEADNFSPHDVRAEESS